MKYQAPKKRNPYVVQALVRKAGKHQKSNKALRRQEKSKKQFGEYLGTLHLCRIFTTTKNCTLD